MDKKIKFRTGIYIIATIVLLVMSTLLVRLTGLKGIIEQNTEINYFDLLGQIANTLIVLSLTSVLSVNFGQAYWVDIKESKLITPFCGCFIGLTVYLLTAVVFSLISYLTGINIAVMVSAVFSTVLLIILTYKMISIYFGKEELKKQLKEVFQGVMPGDLRMYYIPVRETCNAYNEGNMK